MLEIDCQTILGKMEFFERVKRTSCFAVCEDKIGDRWSMWGSAPMIAAKRELRKTLEKVKCLAREKKEREFRKRPESRCWARMAC